MGVKWGVDLLKAHCRNVWRYHILLMHDKSEITIKIKCLENCLDPVDAQ
jgi:hypothetical protein